MSEARPIFREEAVREYSEARMQGRLLQVSPTWTRWTFWLLLATVVGALGTVTLVPVVSWVEGEGIVRVAGVSERAREGDVQASGSVRLTAFFSAQQVADLRSGQRIVVPRKPAALESAILVVDTQPPTRLELQELYRPDPPPDFATANVVRVEAEFSEGEFLDGERVKVGVHLGRRTLWTAMRQRSWP